MEPTDAHRATFELGIKFGALYHQFAGTPISPASAAELASAIESAIENQPHCEEVSVGMKTEAIETAVDPDVGYTEFTGEFADVEILVDYEGLEARGVMEMDDGYPRMRLVEIEDSA